MTLYVNDPYLMRPSDQSILYFSTSQLLACILDYMYNIFESAVKNNITNNMRSKLREIDPGKNFALNVFNLDKIKAINNFYKAYRDLVSIYQKVISIEKRNAESENRPVDLNHVDKLMREYVMKICGPLVNRHRLLFDCGPKRFFATTKGFDQFSASCFCFHSSPPLNDYDTFSVFLEELQYAVTKELYYMAPKTALKRSFLDFIYFIDRFIDRFSDIYKAEIKLTDEGLFQFKKIGSVHCHKENHLIVPRVYYAAGTGDQKIVALPAHYCMDCDMYYIGKTTYKMYAKDFGEMIVEKYQYEDLDKVYSRFNPETRLHAFGYDVSKKGPSEKERRELLVFLIESGRMTYEEICHTIETDIQIFEDRYDRAVAKWESDLKYISDLVVHGKIVRW